MTQVLSNPAWQQAIDSTLVQRLWRPVTRPGLVQAQPGQTLRQRHLRMTGGLPLADQLLRRGGMLLDMPTAQLPIVYAQPWRTGETPILPATQGLTPAQVERPSPIVAAPFAPSAPPTAGVNTALPLAATPAPPSAPPGAAAPAVIQRKVDPTAAQPVRTAPTRAASPPVIQRQVAPASAASSVPIGTPAALFGSSAVPDAASVASHPFTTSLPVVTSAKMAGALGRGADLPLVFPHTSFPGFAPVARGLALDPLVVRPFVRAQPSDVRQSPPPLTMQPLTTAEGLPWAATLPVVSEQRPSIRAADPAGAASLGRLPLVARTPAPSTAVNAQSQLAPALPATAAGKSNLRPSLLAARQTQQTVNTEAIRPPEAKLPPPQVDVEGIASKVYHKFIQTLALEGERRGVR